MLTEVKGLAQGHIAGEWQSRDSSPHRHWVVLLSHNGALTVMNHRTQERICKILGPISARPPNVCWAHVNFLRRAPLELSPEKDPGK